MPVEMYLKLDGVTGGTKNFTYKGWSDVTAWGWGLVSNRSSSHVSDKDMTSFKEISVTKRIGSDTASIMQLYAQGTTVPYAELNVVPVLSKKEGKHKYLALRMEDVLVKSIVIGGTTEEDFFNEKIILLFDKIMFEYSFYSAATVEHAKGTDVDYSFAWDIEHNKPWEYNI
jgi:type VI secretion system secreted protein Hcp